MEVAELANAKEFIESNALENAIMDDPENLLKNMQSIVYKDALIAAQGKKLYDEQLSIIKAQAERHQKHKTSGQVEDLIDRRSKREKGS